jgi:hypothetical protein
VPIYNRRNAVLGWAVWLVSKRVLKRKAKAAAGAATFWRRRLPGKQG